MNQSNDKFAWVTDLSIPPPEKQYFERRDDEYDNTSSVCHLDEQWFEVHTLGSRLHSRNNLLRTYAYLFALNPDDYDLKEYPTDAYYIYNKDYYPVKLITAIKKAAPCDWIQKVEKFLNSSPLAKYLYIYTTDYMLDVYKWIRVKKITENIKTLITGMNQAIYASPRPNNKFMVYRISRFSITAGVSIIIETPKSGTFSINAIQEPYLRSENSTYFRIWIPKNSILSYIPIEDQVVFPTGAQFLAVSDVKEEVIVINGQVEYKPVQDIFYIGAPKQPIVLLDNMIFKENSPETFNSIVDKWDNDQSFPFIEPYSL